jgi:hypothetical protein
LAGWTKPPLEKQKDGEPSSAAPDHPFFFSNKIPSGKNHTKIPAKLFKDENSLLLFHNSPFRPGPSSKNAVKTADSTLF